MHAAACVFPDLSGPLLWETPEALELEPTDTNPEIISSVALSKRGVKEDERR